MGLIDLTIVIPARNEAASLPGVLDDLADAQPDLPCTQVIVVDDHSTDDTRAVARAHARRPIVLTNRETPGYGCTIRTGLRVAVTPWVTIMTADGSDRAADLVRLWQATAKRGQPLIVGDRWLRGTTVGYPLVKRWVNWLGNTYIAVRTHTDYYDWTNPFKLYPTPVVQQVLPACVAPDQSAGLELALRCWQQHPDLCIIGQHWQERRAGRSKFALWQDSWRYYRTVRRVLG